MNQPSQTGKHLIPITLLFILTGVLMSNFSVACHADETTERVVASLSELPEFYDYPDRYRAEPYLQAAITLQALGKDKAQQILRVFARPSSMLLMPLCRLLFTKKADTAFRSPWIGGPALLGDTTPPDWPLDPIAIVDGVPFLITRGYELTGKPESGASYYNYCLTHCEWSSAHFEPKTEAQKQAALKKLIANKTWKRPLNSDEKSFLLSQIKTKK